MDLLHARPSIKEYREPSIFQFASSMASGIDGDAFLKLSDERCAHVATLEVSVGDVLNEETDRNTCIEFTLRQGVFLKNALTTFFKKATSLSSLTLRGKNFAQMTPEYLEAVMQALPSTVQTVSLPDVIEASLLQRIETILKQKEVNFIKTSTAVEPEVAAAASADSVGEFQRPLAWVAKVNAIQPLCTEEVGSSCDAVILNEFPLEPLSFTRDTYVFFANDPNKVILVSANKSQQELSVIKPNHRLLASLERNGFTDKIQPLRLSRNEVSKITGMLSKSKTAKSDVKERGGKKSSAQKPPKMPPQQVTYVSRISDVARYATIGSYTTLIAIPPNADEAMSVNIIKSIGEPAVYIEPGALLSQALFDKLPSFAQKLVKKIRVNAHYAQLPSGDSSGLEFYLVEAGSSYGGNAHGLALPLSWLETSFPEVYQQQATSEFASLTAALGIQKLTDQWIPGLGKSKGPMPQGIPKTGAIRLETLLSSSDPQHKKLLKQLFCSPEVCKLHITEKLDGASVTFFNDGVRIRMFTHTQEVEGGLCDAICKAYDLGRRIPVGCAMQGELIGLNVNGNLYEFFSEEDKHKLRVFRAFRVPIFLAFEGYELADLELLQQFILQPGCDLPAKLKTIITELTYPASKEVLLTPDYFHMLHTFLRKADVQLMKKLSEHIPASLAEIAPNWRPEDACSRAELERLISYCNREALGSNGKKLSCVPLANQACYTGSNAGENPFAQISTCKDEQDIPKTAQQIIDLMPTLKNYFTRGLAEGVVVCHPDNPAVSCKVITENYDAKKQRELELRHSRPQRIPAADDAAAASSATTTTTQYGRSSLYAAVQTDRHAAGDQNQTGSRSPSPP